MTVTRFATTPEVGTALVLRGQRYVMKGSERHQRDDGSFTSFLRWTAHCSECGEVFSVTTSLAIGYLNRRCAKHHRPGRPVATPKTPIRGGHRHD